MTPREKISRAVALLPPYTHEQLMSMGRWKCSAVSIAPILKFLLPFNEYKWASCFSPEIAGANSIYNAFPEGCPHKIVLAKMRKLIRKGWVGGCACGCRGDFYLTDEGREHYRTLWLQKLLVEKITASNPFMQLLDATAYAR